MPEFLRFSPEIRKLRSDRQAGQKQNAEASGADVLRPLNEKGSNFRENDRAASRDQAVLGEGFEFKTQLAQDPCSQTDLGKQKQGCGEQHEEAVD